jgi:hypothetical protein
VNVDLAVYAIVATLSPLGFAATLAVLASAQFATVALLTIVDVVLWPGSGRILARP